MTLRVKPVIIVSVTKKANGQLILNYTRPEGVFVSDYQRHAAVSGRRPKSSKSPSETCRVRWRAMVTDATIGLRCVGDLT
jgi:hypothetical protein